MAADNDHSGDLRERILAAFEQRTALRIVGGGSKAFYGRAVDGEPLSLQGHSGITEYNPTELVITARSGTRIEEIEQALTENRQMLAFEPPRHAPQSTLGGCIACGLSGPNRPFAGAARDFVLGVKIINGRGDMMQFGGQVMKNVAGYDVSRLMAGAQGTLGVLLEISLKVLPRPEAETTRVFEDGIDNAHRRLRDWIHQGRPVTASCYYRGVLAVRLGSTAGSIRAAQQAMGGEAGDHALWRNLRDQAHAVFSRPELWRLSLPPATAFPDGDTLVEWAGALRWTVSDTALYEYAAGLGGHATRYDIAAHPRAETSPFQPLPAAMLSLQQRIKDSMDPHRILNPGRLYPEL